MSYCIYKLNRTASGGGTSGAYKINRDEDWQLIKVNEGDYEAMHAELVRLTQQDSEWLRWNYDLSVLDSFITNPATIHKRTYHLVERGHVAELRKTITDLLKRDGVEVL